jgi:hypothetical protein
MGHYMLHPGIEGISIGLLTQGLNWPVEAVLAFLADVRKDLSNTKTHGY